MHLSSRCSCKSRHQTPSYPGPGGRCRRAPWTLRRERSRPRTSWAGDIHEFPHSMMNCQSFLTMLNHQSFLMMQKRQSFLTMWRRKYSCNSRKEVKNIYKVIGYNCTSSCELGRLKVLVSKTVHFQFQFFLLPK